MAETGERERVGILMREKGGMGQKLRGFITFGVSMQKRVCGISLGLY